MPASSSRFITSCLASLSTHTIAPVVLGLYSRSSSSHSEVNEPTAPCHSSPEASSTVVRTFTFLDSQYANLSCKPESVCQHNCSWNPATVFNWHENCSSAGTGSTFLRHRFLYQNNVDIIDVLSTPSTDALGQVLQRGPHPSCPPSHWVATSVGLVSSFF